MHNNHTGDFTMMFFHEQIEETRRIMQERQGQQGSRLEIQSPERIIKSLDKKLLIRGLEILFVI